MNIADSILSSADLKEEAIHISEWGGDYLIRELTAGQRDEFEALFVGAEKVETRGLRARMVVDCLYTVSGEKVFNESHREALANKSSSVLDRVFKACQKISGIDNPEEAIEEAEGN